MKKDIFILIVFFIGLHISCSKSKSESQSETILADGQFSLKAGECTPEKRNVKVCFQKLITESRCPEGGVCIWQGYAMAEFLLTDGQQSITFNLSTLNLHQFHSDTLINNTKISLVDISPYPSIHNYPSYPGKVIIKIE